MEKYGPYTKKLIKHFKNPHNYGKIENPDGIGIVGNPVCGDIMYLYIKIGKNKKGDDIIKNIRYETLGCVAAIGTSSAVTELAKGKTLEEAMKIDSQAVVKSLGGLPLIKHHCSLLAADALSEAIYNYLLKNKKEIPPEFQKKHERIAKEKTSLK